MSKLDRRDFVAVLAALPILAGCGALSSGRAAAQVASYNTRPLRPAGEVPLVGMGTARNYEDPQTDEQLAPLRATLARFAELGGKVIDTAPSYGRAEEVLGRLISELGVRDRLYLATKVGANNLDEGKAQIERAFYVWLSVFNLFVISIAWSLMADVFRPGQAHRLFGQIAAGASLGGLTGPLLSTLLVGPLGHAGLLLLSAGLLLATLGCVAFLLRWSAGRSGNDAQVDRAKPIGGSIWAGLTLIARSPYLIGISAFVLLLTIVSTFLYMEQARIMEATFPDPVRQTQVFGTIDAVVQALTIGVQLFVTGQVARKLGVRVVLCAVPVLMIFGFGLLALAATFPVFAAVMIARRVGEYAFVRPGREMLFAPVDAEIKYKAKNSIDTAVYRGGDLVGAWADSAILLIGSGSLAAIVGAVIAAVWGVLGYGLGKRHDREVGHKGDEPEASPAGSAAAAG